MNGIVKKLLSLNQLEYGEQALEYDRFDIFDVLRGVLRDTEILQKQQEVTVHFYDDGPCYDGNHNLLLPVSHGAGRRFLLPLSVIFKQIRVPLHPSLYHMEAEDVNIVRFIFRALIVPLSGC